MVLKDLFNIINMVQIINTNSINNKVNMRMGYEVANSRKKNGTI